MPTTIACTITVSVKQPVRWMVRKGERLGIKNRIKTLNVVSERLTDCLPFIRLPLDLPGFTHNGGSEGKGKRGNGSSCHHHIASTNISVKHPGTIPMPRPVTIARNKVWVGMMNRTKFFERRRERAIASVSLPLDLQDLPVRSRVFGEKRGKEKTKLHACPYRFCYYYYIRKLNTSGKKRTPRNLTS